MRKVPYSERWCCFLSLDWEMTGYPYCPPPAGHHKDLTQILVQDLARISSALWKLDTRDLALSYTLLYSNVVTQNNLLLRVCLGAFKGHN